MRSSTWRSLVDGYSLPARRSIPRRPYPTSRCIAPAINSICRAMRTGESASITAGRGCNAVWPAAKARIAPPIQSCQAASASGDRAACNPGSSGPRFDCPKADCPVADCPVADCPVADCPVADRPAADRSAANPPAANCRGENCPGSSCIADRRPATAAQRGVDHQCGLQPVAPGRARLGQRSADRRFQTVARHARRAARAIHRAGRDFAREERQRRVGIGPVRADRRTRFLPETSRLPAWPQPKSGGHGDGPAKRGEAERAPRRSSIRWYRAARLPPAERSAASARP